MKKLTRQQENLQLLGIIGADESNKLLKRFLKNAAKDKNIKDIHTEVKTKKKNTSYLKPVK